MEIGHNCNLREGTKKLGMCKIFWFENLKEDVGTDETILKFAVASESS
jgi:hypothetical protein